MKPQRQLLKPCVMIDEDYKVSTYKKHILTAEEDCNGKLYLFCRACGVND